MAYRIVEQNAVAFADSNSIKFPRFQRKLTWDEKDNFKLCISVFKGYPIGVVIVNSQGNTDYLLDGRQRRNALINMKNDPQEVYLWAKKFVGFTATEDVESVKDKFWSSIDQYLQRDASRANQEKANEAVPDAVSMDDESGTDITPTEDSYDFSTQYASLTTLLDMVTICHPYKERVTNLQRMFEFNGIIKKKNLDYAEPKGSEYVINTRKLKRYIDNLVADGATIESADSFSESLIRRYLLEGESASKAIEYVAVHWDYFNKVFQTFAKSKEVLNKSSIGMISLTNADVLDAQNIFSLVNGSGKPLSAEELLSARPFWNVILTDPSAELLSYKKKMYDFLEIPNPENTCRWDLCSTFLARIDKNGLIFNSTNKFTTSISLSYRVLSSIFVGGMNSTSVTALENPRKCNVDWEVDVEKLICDLNLMISNIEDINYFKTVLAWNQSVMSLTSNAIAVEFCVALYNEWCILGKPDSHAGPAIQKFKQEAVYLFDRLCYEYVQRQWSGSGDNMVASHLSHLSTRFTPVTEKEWTDFIDEIENGSFKGKQTSSKTLRPFLFNVYFLKGMTPVLKDANTKYEIDHLVADSLFRGNVSVDQSYKDNFLNFSVLPKGDNIDKTNKRLNQITDAWLIQQIKKFAFINDADIQTLSDLSKVDHLKTRKAEYLIAYKECRNTLFANL